MNVTKKSLSWRKFKSAQYHYRWSEIYLLSLNAAVATPSFTLYAIFRQLLPERKA